jgi:hypothetical protein
MKNLRFIPVNLLAPICILAPMLFSTTAQVQQHEVNVTNISVPIRIFEDSRFIDDLRITDFEILEEGVPQVIDALYLADRNRLTREEEYKEYFPELNRHYYLIFQVQDYNPKFSEAIDYLFHEVLLPGDSLEITTPVNNYALSPEAWENKSLDALSQELQQLVRKDAKIGASAYRSLMQDLTRLVRALSGARGTSGFTESDATTSSFSLEFLLPRYRETLEKMETLRLVDERRFLAYASRLKRTSGQKNVFFFYQREFRPEIQPRIVSMYMSAYQDQPNILGDLQDLMNFYRRDSRVDVDIIKQAYADSSVFFNFIFMQKDPEHISGIHMREQSEDMFELMSEIALSSGGIVDTSQNPSIAFQSGTDKADHFYILYYTPKDYVKDGKFKNIEVRVKEKPYKLSYRKGYYSN